MERESTQESCVQKRPLLHDDTKKMRRYRVRTCMLEICEVILLSTAISLT